MAYNVRFGFTKRKPKKTWIRNGTPLHRVCGSKFGFIPQGIAATKSGCILLCLWNNEFGERISGKVISIDGKL